MRIQHNIMAMNAYRNYTNNVSAMQKNLEKLSSGYKINRAGDDAAGLAISEKMRAQITGLETAQKNAKDGISLVQTAEGALTEVHDMLNRMVELATQSANGTYDDSVDRNQMQKEIDQLRSEIDRIADSSNFNGINLLDGTLGMSDAFKVDFAAVDAASAQAGADKTSDLTFAAKKAAGSYDHTYHLGKEGTEFAAPEFSIDLTGLAVDLGTATKDKLTVTIGTKTIELDNCAATTASAIANAIRNACKGTGSKDGITFGTGDDQIWFKASGSGAKVTFKYMGIGSKPTAASGTDTITSGAVDAFNAGIGGLVTVTGSASTTTITDSIHHNTVDVKTPVMEEAGGLAGIDVDISKVVKDNYTLSIDGTVYTFKTKATDSDVTATENVIDVSKFAGSSAAMIQEAVNQLSHKTTESGNFRIEAAGTTKIHVDQLADSEEVYDTDAKLKAVFKASAGGTKATGAATKLTVDDAKLKDGNVITIGEGKDAKKFIKGKDFNTAAELKTALEGEGYTVESAAGTGDNTGKTVLTIYGKSGATDAPTVLGKGLTLQIGDTADSFNQLNVSVSDMHCKSLGINDPKMSIADQDSAAKAVDMIKSAINKVSDVRGTLGATQNRLDHTINNLSVMTENIQDAESTIRDVDVAEEMMAYTKNNILIQSAQAMLAQANQVPQGVLQLLQ